MVWYEGMFYGFESREIVVSDNTAFRKMFSFGERGQSLIFVIEILDI